MSQPHTNRPTFAKGKARVPRWTVGDVIDFEEAEQKTLSSQDAESVLREDGKTLSRTFAEQGFSGVPRVALCHAWLSLARSRDSQLFGSGIDRVFSVLTSTSWVMGIVLGCLAVPAYLAYKGEKPINVMVVFFGLIVLPWVITGGSLYFSVWLRGSSSKGSVGAGIAFLVSRLSPEWRASWSDLRRILREHGKRIASISSGLFFGFTQQVACGFGIGALLSILFHVTVFDLAFGWESTLSIGAEFMCFFANVISAPWAWLWTASVPSLEQVRESRFSYLAGMEAASVNATRSWWPFIVGSLMFYVVIPRFLLVVYASWKTSRRLSTLDFTRTQDIALIRRLSGPLFQTKESSRTGFLGEAAEIQSPTFAENGSWNLLLGEGILQSEDSVRGKVEAVLYGKIKRVANVEVDYADGNEEVLQSLLQSEDGVVVAMPADINPVDAIAATLQSFSDASHSKDKVIILFGPEQRQNLWRRWLREKQLGFDLLGVCE
ncbi:MAG: DUF2868 domain-containing protein [Pirellulales bacterium]|nr:DUF2868 domain-containing protein [Pirellulales bacterium]